MSLNLILTNGKGFIYWNYGGNDLGERRLGPRALMVRVLLNVVDEFEYVSVISYLLEHALFLYYWFSIHNLSAHLRL